MPKPSLIERLRAFEYDGYFKICHEAADELKKYKDRCHRADYIILMLTADHNSGPHYEKGLDLAQEYFQDFHHD